jgi:hypothetical protein
VDEARLIERRLARTLHRWDCPDLTELTDYYFHRLGAETAAGIDQHLQSCSACQAELNGLKTFMAEEPREATVTVPQAAARTRRPGFGQWVARLLPQAPSLALRGEAAGPLTAAVGDVLIALDVADQAPAGLLLVGQLAAAEPERWTGALVQLWESNQLRRTALIDDVGGFRMEHGGSGPVELRIIPERGPSLVWSGLVLRA